jgi:hypothetical protein
MEWYFSRSVLIPRLELEPGIGMGFLFALSSSVPLTSTLETLTISGGTIEALCTAPNTASGSGVGTGSIYVEFAELMRTTLRLLMICGGNTTAVCARTGSCGFASGSGIGAGNFNTLHGRILSERVWDWNGYGFIRTSLQSRVKTVTTSSGNITVYISRSTDSGSVLDSAIGPDLYGKVTHLQLSNGSFVFLTDTEFSVKGELTSSGTFDFAILCPEEDCSGKDFSHKVLSPTWRLLSAPSVIERSVFDQFSPVRSLILSVSRGDCYWTSGERELVPWLSPIIRRGSG